ncbi:hypothetical protein EVAR_58896_1 [Eumeta japonica]|uniref:Uncharacterized protein n=1 Tax=Eumeta variegata TaxID=151549 RepID=A0A4C1YX10_EUMVA|nr:hypothetical protein EVAR_58896_1 [Eumeta japonica]
MSEEAVADRAGRVPPAPPPRQAPPSQAPPPQAPPPQPRPQPRPRTRLPSSPDTAALVHVPAPPRLIRPSEHLALVERDRRKPPLLPAVTVLHGPRRPMPALPAPPVRRAIMPARMPAPARPPPLQPLQPLVRLPQARRDSQNRYEQFSRLIATEKPSRYKTSSDLVRVRSFVRFRGQRFGSEEGRDPTRPNSPLPPFREPAPPQISLSAYFGGPVAAARRADG